MKDKQTHIQRKTGFMSTEFLDGVAQHLGSTVCLLCTVSQGGGYQVQPSQQAGLGNLDRNNLQWGCLQNVNNGVKAMANIFCIHISICALSRRKVCYSSECLTRKGFVTSPGMRHLGSLTWQLFMSIIQVHCQLHSLITFHMLLEVIQQLQENTASIAQIF